MAAYNPKYLQTDYKYRRDHFKRVGIDFQKEYYETVLKPAADAAGETVNGYIKEAVRRRIEAEKG